MSLDAGDLQAFGCAEGSLGTKAWKLLPLTVVFLLALISCNDDVLCLLSCIFQEELQEG